MHAVTIYLGLQCQSDRGVKSWLHEERRTPKQKTKDPLEKWLWKLNMDFSEEGGEGEDN